MGFLCGVGSVWLWCGCSVGVGYCGGGNGVGLVVYVVGGVG